MKIVVNGKEMEVSENFTILQLITQLDITAQGVAVGLNNKLVSKQDWSNVVLQENDTLVVIKAACGG